MANYQNQRPDGHYQGMNTGPYNDLENQVRHDPETGEILEIYDPPTGRTDVIAMQHNVDYSVRGDNQRCKHKADRKMVKSLDAIP